MRLFEIRDTDAFDWYQRYAGVKDIITQYITPSHQILNVGCGNSSYNFPFVNIPIKIIVNNLIKLNVGMSEEMYEEGYEHITNIDISTVVIKQMQEKYKEKCSNMKFFTMDVRNLTLENESIDVVIDKGTLDSILVNLNYSLKSFGNCFY